MPGPRQTLFFVVVALSVAVVACQPKDPLVDTGGRALDPSRLLPGDKSYVFAVPEATHRHA